MNYAVDLRLTNEALQRSNADLEQFAYAASHDLQEPLRMISLYTQLLQEEYAGLLDATARSYVDFAVSGAQRMERLLQDLMAYSRVSGGLADTIECSDAAVAVDAALGNLEAAVRKSGAQFHIGQLPSVAVPSVHLVLLFQNLVGNALKYCGGPHPGSVDRCRTGGQALEIYGERQRHRHRASIRQADFRRLQTAAWSRV